MKIICCICKKELIIFTFKRYATDAINELMTPLKDNFICNKCKEEVLKPR